MSVFLLLKLFGGVIIVAIVLAMLATWLVAHSVDRTQAEQEETRASAP